MSVTAMIEPVIEPMMEQDRQIAEVVAQQQSRLASFIRKRVPNPADAEDLVQDVFLAVWRNAGRFDPERGTVRAGSGAGIRAVDFPSTYFASYE